MSNSSRRIKWHPAPPPSPKIIYFPRRRRTRRKHHHHQNNSLLLMHQRFKGNLEINSESKRRERVEEVERDARGQYAFEEEKWRVQAEMLRAECNLLRMEREFALKKLEKNRVKMETTLRSAVQTLLSGRKKICEGKSANTVLEEEIEDLEIKLVELQKSARVKDSEAIKCSNFDKKAWILQRRLEKLSEGTTISKSTKSNHNQVERNKMEGVSVSVSKGMLVLDRGGEDDNTSTITANSSVASSASTSNTLQLSEVSTGHQEEVGDENKCSGRCKAIVRKIVEQVRAETEQWSQMQEMLLLVHREMEELHASRHFWQNRAHHSDNEIQSLTQAVEEWRGKALEHESKADRLEIQVCLLKEEMQKCKIVQVVKEDKDLGAPLSLGKQLANEKRMLLRQSLYEEKENGRRKPFKDIGNSSSLPTQNPFPTIAPHNFRKY